MLDEKEDVIVVDKQGVMLKVFIFIYLLIVELFLEDIEEFVFQWVVKEKLMMNYMLFNSFFLMVIGKFD